MIYFTADLHLGHNGIIRMRKRPFKNAEEMNRVLIANINSLVRKEDDLYILGDLAHKLDLQQANELIKKIHGRLFLLRGNHDKLYDETLFAGIYDYLERSFNGHDYVMMHYPLLSWKKMRNGSIMLHGHIHSDESHNLLNRENGIFRYDVGVDANGYFPVSLMQIEAFFKDASLKTDVRDDDV